MADISRITTTDGSTYDVKDVTARIAMTGATASSNGAGGQVPAPQAGDQTKFLRGDGTWTEVAGATSITNAEIDALFTSG